MVQTGESTGEGSGRISAATVNPPATSYAGVQSPLLSVQTKQYVIADPRNAPIVNRKESKKGLDFHYVYGGQPEAVPRTPDPPVSSRFQQTLVRLWPWSINRAWYICYPAATVMNGGKRNQGLSFRSPQITTRTSGGPGAFLMGARPRFTKVQTVPRFPTAPPQYKTTSAPG